MSPEQLTGEPVGPASDIFCLGAVLTFAATGTGPFGSGSLQAMVYRIVHQDPDLSVLPPKLRTVVARCLAKRPEQRPSASELLDELAEGIPGGATIVEFFTGSAWLPQAVARTVRTRAAALSASSGTPTVLAEPPIETPADALTGERTEAPARTAPAQPAESAATPPRTLPLPDAPTGAPAGGDTSTDREAPASEGAPAGERQDSPVQTVPAQPAAEPAATPPRTLPLPGASTDPGRDTPAGGDTAAGTSAPTGGDASTGERTEAPAQTAPARPA